MTIDSGSIWFMRIFAVVLKIYVNFPDFMPTPIYYVYTYLAFFRYQVQMRCLLQLLSANMLRQVVKCGLAEMLQADWRNVICRVFGIRGKTADLS